jgi:hypothetical protein
MSAHTPGPWHVEHGTPSGRRLVADLVVESNHGLTDYRIVHEGESDGAGEADALLIASAPRMAELLLSAWQHVSHGGPSRADVETVLREAGLLDAKAEGRSEP